MNIVIIDLCITLSIKVISNLLMTSLNEPDVKDSIPLFMQKHGSGTIQIEKMKRKKKVLTKYFSRNYFRNIFFLKF